MGEPRSVEFSASHFACTNEELNQGYHYIQSHFHMNSSMFQYLYKDINLPVLGLHFQFRVYLIVNYQLLSNCSLLLSQPYVKVDKIDIVDKVDRG